MLTALLEAIGVRPRPFFYETNRAGVEEGHALLERFARHADRHGYKDRPFIEATLKQHPDAVARLAYADRLFDKVWWELSLPNSPQTPLPTGTPAIERAIVYQLGIGQDLWPDCIYADALPALHLPGVGDLVFKSALRDDPTYYTRDEFGKNIEAITTGLLRDGKGALEAAEAHRKRLLDLARVYLNAEIAPYFETISLRPGTLPYLEAAMLVKLQPTALDLLCAFVRLQDPVVYNAAVIEPLRASSGKPTSRGNPLAVLRQLQQFFDNRGTAARIRQWSKPLDLADYAVKLKFAAGELVTPLEP